MSDNVAHDKTNDMTQDMIHRAALLSQDALVLELGILSCNHADSKV